MWNRREAANSGNESDFFDLDNRVIGEVFRTLLVEERRLIKSYFYGYGQYWVGKEEELGRLLRRMKTMGNNIQDRSGAQNNDQRLVTDIEKREKYLGNNDGEKLVTSYREDTPQFLSQEVPEITRPPRVPAEYCVEGVRYEARKGAEEWTEAELMSYLVAVKRSECGLLKSHEYPDTIVVSETWGNAINQLSSSRMNSLLEGVRRWIIMDPDRSVGISQVVKSYRNGAGFSEKDLFDADWWKKVNSEYFLGEIGFDSWTPPLFVLPADKQFISLKTVYGFASERVKLPVKVAGVITKNYWLLRGQDTTNIPGLPSNSSYLEFRDLWYRQSGVDMVPMTGIRRFFSIDGIPWFDPNGNRREIGLRACRALNITVYESDIENGQRLVKLT